MRQLHAGSEVLDGMKEQPVFSHLLIRSYKITNRDKTEKGPGTGVWRHQLLLYGLRTEHPMKSSTEREMKGSKDPFKTTLFMLLKVK